MIISYAQNFEDVILWRALGNLEAGFYIDVGANDPALDSVTKLFYDNGWTGINIEPIAQWVEKLEAERPRDINLKLAAGSESGEITLFDLPDTGLSTSDRSTAERHEVERGYSKREVVVSVRTLADICREYCPQEIHFLKVDVEGAEYQVIMGMDFTEFRPWIVVIEATLPNLPVTDYADWDPVLIENGYKFVYFDGLNRFYLSTERHQELEHHFLTPPNTFDRFDLASRIDAEKRAQQASEQADSDRLNLHKVQERALQELQSVHEENNQNLLLTKSQAEEISALRNSLSWRITAPLRRPVAAIKGATRRVISALTLLLVIPKKIVLFVVNMTITFILNRPTLTTKLSRLLDHLPWLRSLAYRAMYHSRSAAYAEASSSKTLASYIADSGEISEERMTFDERPKGMGSDKRSPLESKFR
jgi:FkbM family methyltransferase